MMLPMLPFEPAPTTWVFPPVDTADENGVVGVGADLRPGTVLAAYRHGLFPMPVGRRQLGWWSPDPRGVLSFGALTMARSLRKACRNFEIRVDTAFEEVMKACANPARAHGWITEEIQSAYGELHRLGWAHSVEAWQGEELVGGLYGIAIGGFFAGESMFHRVTDASKVALVALTNLLDQHPDTLIDVQWATPHLESLGVVEIDREDYLARLAIALSRPLPPAWTA